MDDGNKKGTVFALICIAGFALILIFVPRAVNLIALRLGRQGSRAAGLLFVAIFWYIWGEICVRIKNKMDID